MQVYQKHLDLNLLLESAQMIPLVSGPHAEPMCTLGLGPSRTRL